MSSINEESSHCSTKIEIQHEEIVVSAIEKTEVTAQTVIIPEGVLHTDEIALGVLASEINVSSVTSGMSCLVRESISSIPVTLNENCFAPEIATTVIEVPLSTAEMTIFITDMADSIESKTPLITGIETNQVEMSSASVFDSKCSEMFVSGTNMIDSTLKILPPISRTYDSTSAVTVCASSSDASDLVSKLSAPDSTMSAPALEVFASTSEITTSLKITSTSPKMTAPTHEMTYLTSEVDASAAEASIVSSKMLVSATEVSAISEISFSSIEDVPAVKEVVLTTPVDDFPIKMSSDVVCVPSSDCNITISETLNCKDEMDIDNLESDPIYTEKTFTVMTEENVTSVLENNLQPDAEGLHQKTVSFVSTNEANDTAEVPAVAFTSSPERDEASEGTMLQSVTNNDDQQDSDILVLDVEGANAYRDAPILLEDSSSEESDVWTSDSEEDSSEEERSAVVTEYNVSSSSSSSSDEDEPNDDPIVKNTVINKNASQSRKKKGKGSEENEIMPSIGDLPRIEDLTISVPEEEAEVIGKITSIVEQLVIIQAFDDLRPIDLDSVLFRDNGKEALGKVFDVIGCVNKPLYVVRFNDLDHVKEKGITIGEEVFFAPRTDHCTFVDVEYLMSLRGSDASWEHDREPPPAVVDYSDDEDESGKSREKQNNTRKAPQDVQYVGQIAKRPKNNNYFSAPSRHVAHHSRYPNSASFISRHSGPSKHMSRPSRPWQRHSPNRTSFTNGSRGPSDSKIFWNPRPRSDWGVGVQRFPPPSHFSKSLTESLPCHSPPGAYSACTSHIFCRPPPSPSPINVPPPSPDLPPSSYHNVWGTLLHSSTPPPPLPPPPPSTSHIPDASFSRPPPVSPWQANLSPESSFQFSRPPPTFKLNPATQPPASSSSPSIKPWAVPPPSYHSKTAFTFGSSSAAADLSRPPPSISMNNATEGFGGAAGWTASVPPPPPQQPDFGSGSVLRPAVYCPPSNPNFQSYNF